MPPTLLAVAITGGLRRTLKTRSVRYWLAFLFWLCLATLFSSWRGGSANAVLLYFKGEFLMLFAACGLAMTWKEYTLIAKTLFLAAGTDLFVGRVFMSQLGDRIALNLGGSTIANSNDFAVHMILMMAFLLYAILLPKAPMLLRLACFPLLAYGVYLILSAGSRGALVAMAVFALFAFAMGSGRQRLILIGATPVMAMVAITAIPRTTLLRLSTITSDTTDREVQADAEGSAEARRALFIKSVEYTVQHPVFGVGPGIFSDFEGGESQRAGRHGMWHETHNSFTQISSECGIPALLLFLAAIGSAFRLAWKTYRQSRGNPRNGDIAAASLSLMLGIVGFLSAAMFANFGYRFYEPALCGLCIVLYSAAQHEMAARQAGAPAHRVAARSLVPHRSFRFGSATQVL